VRTRGRTKGKENSQERTREGRTRREGVCPSRRAGGESEMGEIREGGEGGNCRKENEGQGEL